MLQVHAVRHLILLNVGLILQLEHVIGNLDVLAELIYIHKRVARHTPFGDLIFRPVLFVGRANLRLIRRNLALQVFRLDQGIVQLDFFILVAELLLKFRGPHADPVGHQLAEFFLQQSLTDQLFEHRHGQLEARLDFGRIAVHADKRTTVECRRNVLANAVCPLLVGHGNSETLGFIFNLFFKYELLQDLLGVKGLEGLHVLIALLDLVELLAHILHANRLVPDLGHGFGGDLAADRRLRNEVKQHAASEDQDDDPQKDAIPQLALIFCSSHPMNLPRP